MRFLTVPYRPKFSPRQQWLLVGLVWLAFGLRLYRLGRQSIWFDEALSILFAMLPPGESVEAMLTEGLHHSPLFYFLLRPYVAGGFTEFGARFLPVVLGVLAIPLMAHLGRLMFNPQIGLLGAGLLLISPFHVWYSQEARMYTLVILSALGSMFFFSRALRHPRRKSYWLALAGFTILGINSHHFAFFTPLIQFLFIATTLKRNYHLLRPWVLSQLVVGASFVPWILIVLDWGQFYLSSASLQPPTLYDLVQTFWNFSIGYTVMWTPLVAIALLLFLLLLILGLLSSFRTDEGLLLLLWVAVPPLLTFLVSLRLPTYLDRYISLSLPPFLLLVVVGLSRLWPRNLRLGLAALLLGLVLFGLHRVYFDRTVYERANWRSLGAYLSTEVSAEEELLAPLYYQYLQPLIFYYEGDITAFRPVISFNQFDMPAIPPDGKLHLIIAYPNHSAHLVGHCQPFSLDALKLPEEVLQWRAAKQDRLSKTLDVTCIRLETYE